MCLYEYITMICIDQYNKKIIISCTRYLTMTLTHTSDLRCRDHHLAIVRNIISL